MLKQKLILINFYGHFYRFLLKKYSRNVRQCVFYVLLVFSLSSCAKVPDSATAFYQRGIEQEKNAESDQTYEDAKFYFDQAIALNPNKVESYIKRGEIAMQYWKFSDAVNDFTTAIGLQDKNFDLYNQRGTAYYRLGKRYEAAKDFTKSIQLNLNNPVAPMNLCYLYAEAKQYAYSLRYCQQVLLLEPQNPYAIKLRDFSKQNLNRSKNLNK